MLRSTGIIAHFWQREGGSSENLAALVVTLNLRGNQPACLRHP